MEFRERVQKRCHCEPVTDVTGVAIPYGDATQYDIKKHSYLQENNCSYHCGFTGNPGDCHASVRAGSQ